MSTARVREYTDGRLRVDGCRPASFINTYGCQMNVHDSEKIAGMLRDMGYAQAPSQEEAELVVFNTCCVRENAENKLYGNLGRLKNHKKVNPRLKVILCGCMMQQDAVVEKLRKSYPYVDVIFGTHNLHTLPQLLDAAIDTGGQVVDVWGSQAEIVEDLPVERGHSFKAGVNIMYGCNNYCTFCIVPYVRGKERSRKLKDIVEECRRLVDDGVREVMLLGQNVNSYGRGIGESFAGLLRELNAIDGLERIRFMSPHPKDFGDDVIEALTNCSTLCPSVHLPLQSGSNEVLRRMKRFYTKEGFIGLAERIKAARPGMRITSDIIVGFPGETEADFEHTLDVVRSVRFQNVFMFQYSKRNGTPAAAMDGQIPEEVVRERFERLMAEVNPIAAEISASNMGRVLGVLVDSADSEDPTALSGRTEDNTLVHFKGGQHLLGSVVDVRITGYKSFYLLGETADMR